MTRRALAVMLLAAPLFAAAAPTTPAPQRFGKPMKGLAAAKLEDVLAKPVAGQEVRLEGTIDAVCKSKGCWMTLKQADKSVHVTFEGYSFFVPKDAASRSVIIEGKVIVKPADPAEVAHLRKEGAGAAAADKVSVEAYAVEIAAPR